MELYGWQKDCLHAWEANQYRGIAQVVTGAGKTVMALQAILLLQKKAPRPFRIRIVVPTCALAAQWARQMRQFLPDLRESGRGPGQFGGGTYENADQEYMIYVVNSARGQLARHVLADWKAGRDVFLIADECHHYGSPENRKIFDFFFFCKKESGSFYSLGLSATPQTQGLFAAPGARGVLEKVIFSYGFAQAASAGNVSPFSVYQVRISFTPEELAEYEDYSRRLAIVRRRLLLAYPELRAERAGFPEAVRKLAAAEDGGEDGLAAMFLALSRERRQVSFSAVSRLGCVRELVRRLPADEKIMIFGERIEQADAAARLLSLDYPGKICRYHSRMKKDARKYQLERFRTGECRILVSCRGLDEGADIPDAAAGIILSGSGVRRQRIQRLGRILRKSPQKKLACLYYLYIKEAAEDSAFLADLEGESFPICSLSYSDLEHTFIHPAYEDAAARVSRQLGAAIGKPEADSPRTREIRSCLDEGLIRPDWLLSEEECSQRAAQAQSRHERNYWICMRALSRCRLCGG